VWLRSRIPPACSRARRWIMTYPVGFTPIGCVASRPSVSRSHDINIALVHIKHVSKTSFSAFEIVPIDIAFTLTTIILLFTKEAHSPARLQTRYSPHSQIPTKTPERDANPSFSASVSLSHFLSLVLPSSFFTSPYLPRN
jgi:hypothetical protein